MSNLKKVLLVVTFASSVFSCKSDMKKQHITNQKEQEVAEKANFSGNYVSNGYDERNQGYDWVAVTVNDGENDQLKISVRSRADKKKPTCTFDTTLQRFDENAFSTVVDGKTVFFRFNENEVVIETEMEEDKNILSFYCSGGASLEGTYSRIDGPLDQNQIDKTLFSKVLNLEDIGFSVSALEEDGKKQLKISTFGLPHEFDEVIDIQNQVVLSAEVEDLNSDGSPELVIFTEENDGNHKGHLYAFSVNNKKSMSAVYFQPTQENKEINSGYNGNDEFALVETSLVQRFPIFENKTKTERFRQIQYVLEEGEATRKFVVRNQTEYEN